MPHYAQPEMIVLEMGDVICLSDPANPRAWICSDTAVHSSDLPGDADGARIT